jgi:uncharacterized protein YukE
MPQAIIDPAELRRFAYQLKQFNADLQTNLGALHGRLLGLGDTWRDQEHQKFLAEFEETIRAVSKFHAACELHIPFLLRKAERAEEYLAQR